MTPLPNPSPLDPAAARRRYAQHLSDSDRALLDAAAPGVPLADALDRPAVFDAVFAAGRTPLGEPSAPPAGELLVASPFLVFAAAVHRTAAELTRTSYVPEWTGPRRRVPLFAGGVLAGFLADPWHRLFLAELLASYASVASGTYWTRTARGWRRRRYSELDPVRLAGLLDAVPDRERSGVYRRLGDLALFLTGVFPDATAAGGLAPVQAGRLLRAAGVPAGGPDERSGIALFEVLGARWYRLAASTALVPTGETRLLVAVADRFADARRVLNVLTDRFLFPLGNPWFTPPRGTG